MHTRFRPPLVLACLYGTTGFGIGFVFGAVRQLLLAPQFGDRLSHWLELPFVTTAIAWLGWWFGTRKAKSPGQAGFIGFGGLLCLLLIEAVFALQLMGMPLEAYLATFDLSRGALFPYGLAVMAVMPWLGWRMRN